MVGRSSLSYCCPAYFQRDMWVAGRVTCLSCHCSHHVEVNFHTIHLFWLMTSLEFLFCRSRNSEHLRKKKHIDNTHHHLVYLQTSQFFTNWHFRKMHVQPILSHLFRAFNLKLGPPNRTWPFSSQSPPKQTFMFQSQDFDHWNHLLPKQIERCLGIHRLRLRFKWKFLSGAPHKPHRHTWWIWPQLKVRPQNFVKKKTWFDFGNKHTGYM